MRNKVKLLLALMLALASVPATAQFSDAYNFFKAVKDRDVLAAKNLIDKPGSVVINQRDLDSGVTALILVTRRRDAPWMRFLIEEGADINARDRDGNTALHVATMAGYADGVRLLIAFKANVNAVNGRGQTALFKAVERRDADMVKLLLDNGADPDIPEHQTGMSPRDLARSDPRAGPIGRLLAEAPERVRKPVAGPSL
ncbi:MAG: ankyrin repeat domain-containing protein [Sphingomonadaceae bacterium]